MVDDKKHYVSEEVTKDRIFSNSQRIFVAPSVTQAMQVVRQEMGDQAVIVQVRRRAGESGLVEVIASEHAEQDQVAEYIPAHEPPPALLKQLALWIAQLFAEPLQLRLLQEGEKLARLYPKDDPRDLLAELLGKELLIEDIVSKHARNMPVILFGPAGMGKTSVAMKIAVSHRLENLQTRLINLDGKRLGSRYTLSNFAKLTDVKLHNLQEDGAVRKLSEQTGELTIIDTSPINPLAFEDSESVFGADDRLPMKRLLVLSILGDEALLLRMIDGVLNFSTVDGLVFTGLDIVPDYRKMINLSMQSGIPLSAINNSSVLSSPLPRLDVEFILDSLWENEKYLQ